MKSATEKQINYIKILEEQVSDLGYEIKIIDYSSLNIQEASELINDLKAKKAAGKFEQILREQAQTVTDAITANISAEPPPAIALIKKFHQGNPLEKMASAIILIPKSFPNGGNIGICIADYISAEYGI